MDFNFVDPTEEEDTLDLSDLFGEEEEPEDEIEVAGYDISFEDDVPEALELTDPKVRKRARRAKRKKRKPKPSMYVGSKKPYVHGLCKEGTNEKLETLPAHHEVCKLYEEWNARAGIPCACEECDHPQTVEELTNGKDARKSSRRPSRQRVRSELKPLSRSDDEEFVLVID